ncbi:hypothetical protein [Halobellus ruber]|uniref:Uncharacterized protein n=1 Tax=Halobellus ruber TaxID=2761102 RepID=A0A7J9SKG5_9EURY|nr:hypothetical protein [Halobellus ruber]MBB6645511.1 hypothetical protein [Halobellus ruber]
MYERAFDTDWESLSGEEASRRMYALGIAAELGYENHPERERIRGLASSAYERTVLDLAYEEGKRTVQDTRIHHDSEEDAWEELVETSEAPSPESLSIDGVDSGRPSATDRPSLLDGFDGDDLGRLRLPSLLERDEE